MNVRRCRVEDWLPFLLSFFVSNTLCHVHSHRRFNLTKSFKRLNITNVIKSPFKQYNKHIMVFFRPPWAPTPCVTFQIFTNF